MRSRAHDHRRRRNSMELLPRNQRDRTTRPASQSRPTDPLVRQHRSQRCTPPSSGDPLGWQADVSATTAPKPLRRRRRSGPDHLAKSRLLVLSNRREATLSGREVRGPCYENRRFPFDKDVGVPGHIETRHQTRPRHWLKNCTQHSPAPSADAPTIGDCGRSPRTWFSGAFSVSSREMHDPLSIRCGIVLHA